MMQRSQCENENVQFVQELAEVDGPFESPININFRDLTKLELPSLCWNRSEVCPQKMKITNTGHTVIISGKWKCERPYLSGGPLMGKYVFSQIHFHWGQDECMGSEHKVCGEGFPLEMHAAHFKTDYLSQENALKEKDGMVVVAYLFKLQNEPNPAFKKIISFLPHIQQSCTSQAIEPRPIMSLINPFTDDYFMYWGSVITPTCAHILLWIVCREPLGISREQVEEFRKIMDSSQHPICRNSRDVQPVHKRNVFHVNASRDLDNPLLPIKQMLGCFCKGSEENVNVESPHLEECQRTHECNCPAYFRNQEEIEGIVSENKILYPVLKGALNWNSGFPGSVYLKRKIYVESAIITRRPLLAKKFESEMIRKARYPVRKEIRSEDKIKTNELSESVCFFPINKINQIKPWPERSKKRERKKPNSFKAFSNILSSFEALKHHTFKKLREIDAINQEIKGMKPFCKNAEDKRWLQKIEKVMTSQKLVTIKKSQNCLGELKKLARGCNFDRVFDNKRVLNNNRNYQKIMKIKSRENKNSALPSTGVFEKKLDDGDNLTVNQTATASVKVQKLIRSFFEDINETEELQKSLKKSLMLKNVEHVDKKNAEDSESKGYITPKMFVMGNFGDRFFTEVTTEADAEEEKVEEMFITVTESPNNEENDILERKYEIVEKNENKNESMVPLHKAIELSKLNEYSKDSDDSEINISDSKNQLDRSRSTSDNESLMKSFGEKNFKKKKKPMENYFKQLNGLPEENFMEELKSVDGVGTIWNADSNSLVDLKKAEEMFKSKFYKSKSRGSLGKRKPITAEISLKSISSRRHCKSKAKNFRFKCLNLKKTNRSKNSIVTNSCREDNYSKAVAIVNNSKWKQVVNARIELVTEKSESSDSQTEYGIISPKRRKVKRDKRNKNLIAVDKMPTPKSGKMLIDEGVKGVEKNTETNNQEEAVGLIERVSELKMLTKEPSEKCREAVTQTATSSIEFKSTKDPQYNFTIAICGTTSAESRNNLKIKRNKEKSKMIKTFQEDEDWVKTNLEIPKARFKNSLVKHKSLSSLTTLSSNSPLRISYRVFIENINSRRKHLRNLPDLKKTEIPQEIEGCKKLQDIPKEPVKEEKSVKPAEDFPKSAVKQVDEELGPTNQFQREKSRIPLVKRTHGQKYGIPRRKRKEVDSCKQKPIEEVLGDIQRSGSKKCLPSDKIKENERQEEKSESKTPPVFSSVKRNSASRCLSAKNLNSFGRSFRRKNRKRPNICKKNSKNYVKKTSLLKKKTSKVESNPLQETVVPDQKQLKSVTNDLANYLRQSLVGFEHQLNSEENIVKGIEEIMLKNLKKAEENEKETTVKEISATEEKKGNQEEPQTEKKPEVKTTQPKQDVKPIKGSAEISKAKSRLPKPTVDFLKRNKLLAGKPKKAPLANEKKTEVKGAASNSMETGKKNSHPDSRKPDNRTGHKMDVKKYGTRIPKSLGKSKPTKQGRPAPSEAKDCDQANGEGCEKLIDHPSEVAVQKVSYPRILPAYMMTSDLSPSLEMVQNQQKQLNKYSLNKTMGNSTSEGWKENLRKEKGDFLPKKDLEYLLTLQKRGQDEESVGREKSVSYVKTLLSQDCNEMTVIADQSTNDPFEFYESLDFSDPGNNGIVLIEMSDFLDSSTSNSDLSGYFKLKELDNLSHLKNKIHISKTSQESGDPGIVNRLVNRNSQKQWHSDSNYDCKIFIKLSSNSNESENHTQVQSTTGGNSSGAQETSNKSSTILRNRSLSLTQQRKKRKETDISPEMKQKLFRMLEAEIRREISVKCSESAETLSEGYALYALEDLEVNHTGQSTENFDNLEVLAEMSETMRQYLSNFKEADESVVLKKKP